MTDTRLAWPDDAHVGKAGGPDAPSETGEAGGGRGFGGRPMSVRHGVRGGAGAAAGKDFKRWVVTRAER